MTKEVEETKSTDTAVLLYQRKYHEIKVKEENQEMQISDKTAENFMLKSERD